MSRQIPAVAVAVAAVGLIASACECEHNRALKAIDSFMGFSRRHEDESANKRPAYTVRSRQEAFARGRSRAIAHIEVDPASDHNQIEQALRDACHHPGLSRNVAALKAIAWPGQLRVLVGPAGEGVFARDGHGWKGVGVGFESIQVNLPAPAVLRERGLSLPTEDEYLHALGVDNLIRRGEPMDSAISLTARHHGVPVATIRSAVDKLQSLYGAPDAEKE